MAGISDALYDKIRKALLEVDVVNDPDQLRAFFVTEKLRPFRSRLKTAVSTEAQVTLLIDALVDANLSTGENALVLFLQVLGHRYDPGDVRHAEFLELAEQLQNVHVDDVPPTATSKLPAANPGSVYNIHINHAQGIAIGDGAQVHPSLTPVLSTTSGSTAAAGHYEDGPETLLLQQILDENADETDGTTTETLLKEVGTTIQQSIENQRPAMFDIGGLCAGRFLTPMLDRFFVAQEFRADKDDLLLALGSALRNFQLQPYRADQDIEPGHILCKLAGKIQSTLFSIFELTRTQNRNVYLELGIALGLRRAFLLVQENGAPVSPLVQGLDYYHVRSYTTLKRELGERLHNALLNIAHYQRQDLPTAGATPTYILAHGDHDMPTDFCLAVAQPLANRKLNPVLIGEDNNDILDSLEQEQISGTIVDSTMQTRLNATVDAIQSAKFGIYRIDAACTADTFLALGIAIGLNRPWLLLNRRGTVIPADVRRLSAFEFTHFGELEQEFPRRFASLLDRYIRD